MQVSLFDLGQFQAVIFDMNGTIIDDGRYHDDAFTEFFRRHNLNLTGEDYHRRFHARKNEEIMAELFDRELSEQEIAALSQEKEDIYQWLYAPDFKEVAGFSNLLEKLKARGLKVALATSSAPTNVEFTFNHLDLRGKLDALVDGHQVAQAKPAPDIYLKTAEELGVPPEACLVFEDTPIGIEAARKAGMTVVAVNTSHAPETLVGSALVINDFTELTALLPTL